ncbi:reverse transcriptase domain, reverse transcriptase zinc-binding domain protein [Tanacetum coccineum]
MGCLQTCFEELSLVPSILNVFYIASDLKININKSNLYGVRVSSSKVDRMAAGIGCASGSFPFPYLGGQVILIKLVLDSLGIHYLSIFKAPKVVIKTLESVCASFFGAPPRLFHLERKKNCLCRDRVANGSWSWHWSRPINVGRSQAEFVSLLGEIRDLEIDDDGDSCVSSLSHDGGFSVSNVRKHIDDCVLPNLLQCIRLYNFLPRKVNIFMWRLSLHRLPRRFNLSSRGLDIVSIMCTVCNRHVESNIHVFFSCDTTSTVWSLFRAWSDSKILILSSYEDLDSWLLSRRASKDSKDRAYVGDVSLIRFWKDTWLGDAPLCIQYNRLFHLEKEKNCLVRDRIANGSWSWDWSRPINVGRSQAEFVSLLGEIGDMEIDDDDDSYVWSLSHDGGFSVSNVRKHIDDCMLPNMLQCTRRYEVFRGRLTFLCGACFWIDSLIVLTCHLGGWILIRLCARFATGMWSPIHVFFSYDTTSTIWRIRKIALMSFLLLYVGCYGAFEITSLLTLKL